MYGRTLLNGNNSILPTRVSADGSPQYKAGGITIDWTTVTATGTSTTTLADGSTIGPAQKFLRYGQVVTKVAATGYFGPFDSGASDGRQTLNRGDAFILDETIPQYDTGSSFVNTPNDQTGRALEGGLIFIDRVLQSGTNSHSLAAGPTLSETLSAFPAVRLAKS